MKVFMLGWEFPPHISGGLGTACFGLTRGLDEVGVEVSFVLPTALSTSATSHVQLKTPADLPPAAAARVESIEMLEEHYKVFEHVTLHRVDAVLVPYATPETYTQAIQNVLEQQKSRLIEGKTVQTAPAAQPAPSPNAPVAVTSAGTFQPGAGAHYAGDMMAQVNRYARLAVELAQQETMDVIHAHDWMTYPAGTAVKAATGKPLIVHVHSTEFDRSGEHVDQRIYDIERMGMHVADMVVCVSHLTRSIVLSRYGVPPHKVRVLYNAVNLPSAMQEEMEPIRQNEKIVLFLGRLTMQKGPEYFLRAAKKVLEVVKNVRFVVAGSGDMITRCIEEAATLRIGRNVTFTGFLRGGDVDRVFAMADLYVMPSVSEPFGIAPLEALSHNVPVIISKQSGVSEVLTHALKVDFWDVDEMANKILAVLRHPPLQKTLRQHGQIELRKFSWTDSARQLKDYYAEVAR